MSAAGFSHSDDSDECKSEDELRRVLDSSSSDGDPEIGSPSPQLRQKVPSGQKLVKQKNGKPLNTAEKKRGDDYVISETESDSESAVSDIKEAPFVAPFARCKLHNLKIHSYHAVTRKLLCTLCIQDKQIPLVQIRTVPQAVREIRGQIAEAKEMTKLRKL